jgi:O-antigen/teichoic acid export membrane protein
MTATGPPPLPAPPVAAAAAAAAGERPPAAAAGERPPAPAATPLERSMGWLAAHGLGQLAARILPALLAPLLLPLYTHYLDQGEYGALSYVTTAVMLLTAIGSVWLSTAAVRFHPRSVTTDADPAAVRRFAAMTMAAAAASAVAVAGVSWIGIEMLASDESRIRALLPLVAPLVLLNVPVQVGLNVLRGGHQVARFVALTLVSQVLGLAASASLLVAGYGACGVLVGSILGAALTLPWLARGLLGGRARDAAAAPRPARGPHSRHGIRQLASYGLPLAAANLAYWVFTYSDRWVIEACRGVEELGVYSLGYDLGDRCAQLALVPFIAAMTPVVVATWTREGELVTRRLLAQTLRFYTMLMLPIAVGLGLVAEPLVELLTSSAGFRGAAPVVPWVAASALCFGLTQVAAQGLYLRRRSHVFLAGMSLAAAVNLILNLLLIPSYGYRVAPMTTLLSHLVLLGFTLLAGRRALALDPPWAELARVAFAAALMAAAVSALGDGARPAAVGLALQVPAGAAVYATALVAVRGLRAAEWSALVRLLRSRAA